MGKRTYAFQGPQPVSTALGLCVFGEAKGILGDAVGKVAVGLASEGSAAKDQLVCTYAQGPPINGVSVTAFSENFRGHIRHGACDARQESLVRVVDSDVEVGDMSMPALIEEDVVRFQVPEDMDKDKSKRHVENRIRAGTDL